ncbi:hypothetical protein HDU67_000612, partial [Dinochytrium kinnereticum]
KSRGYEEDERSYPRDPREKTFNRDRSYLDYDDPRDSRRGGSDKAHTFFVQITVDAIGHGRLGILAEGLCLLGDLVRLLGGRIMGVRGIEVMVVTEGIAIEVAMTVDREIVRMRGDEIATEVTEIDKTQQHFLYANPKPKEPEKAQK